MQSARKHDLNGWYEIADNPLSKSGVFEYLGASISAPEPDRIYRVYRPESELSDPACINSFKLLPWVVDHDMLGEGELPAEKKGVEGIVGQDVYYQDGYLKGNIKVFSDRLAELIQSGMKELSLGYKCVYEFEPGSFEGQPFDAIQRKIRGNHLATVEEGRMGRDVSVLDNALITFDSRDFVMARRSAGRATGKAPQTKPQEQQTAAQDETEMMDEGGEMTLADMSMMMSKLMPLIEEVEKLKGMMNGSEAEAETEMMENENGEMENGEMEDGEMMEMKEGCEMEDMEDEEEKDENHNGMDGLKKQLVSIRKELSAIKSQQTNALDSKTLIQSINQRDNLAARLSHHVGSFDSANMTASEVALYGVKKLGIPCDQGNEQAALSAYMHNRQPARYVKHGSSTTDSAEDFITQLFEGA